KSMVRLKLPQAGSLNPPSQMRAHQSVMNLAVDGELLSMSIFKPILFGAHQNEFRSLLKLRRCWNPMQPGQGAQVFIGRHPAGLLADRGPLRFGKKRLLGMELEAIDHHPT